MYQINDVEWGLNYGEGGDLFVFVCVFGCMFFLFFCGKFYVFILFYFLVLFIFFYFSF